MRNVICLLLLLTVSVAASAQQTHKLRVYQHDGRVDTLLVGDDATISHSRLGVYNDERQDLVSLLIEDTGDCHQYMIADIDSLVLSNGKRVVFRAVNAVEDKVNAKLRKTSLSGNFPGTATTGNVIFYWTENDHIRLDVGDDSRAESLSSDRRGATFVFDDLDDSVESYTVYYPDKSVTILSQQVQNGADNSDHIGRSGDCGIAMAGKNGDTYDFTLQHKASYLCFLPYIDYLPSVKVTKIVLDCNNGIAGEYNLSPSGLYNPTSTSQQITLNLNPSRKNDFLIGHNYATDQDSCAAYMVVAPQDAERSFTATYYLTDTLSRHTTLYKHSFKLKPLANTVHPIASHIPESLFREVDLGFDYVWSNVNLGALLPNETGDYYAWGETAAKTNFTKEDYIAGVDDEVTDIGGSAHDVATQVMGSAWQLPGASQLDELLNSCTWQLGEYAGTRGWIITGSNNGNDDVEAHRIFLPLSGYKDGMSVINTSGGYYWTAGRVAVASEEAHALSVTDGINSDVAMKSWLGMNVRPVRPVVRSFNIPYSGTNEVDLRTHGPGYTIRVYDHAGPDGNYSNSANGYLHITCAEGYKLNIYGTIDTEGTCDPFEVYDITPEGNVLLSHQGGHGITVNTTSKTNDILLRFHSDGSVISSGLDLTIQIQRQLTTYNIEIEDVTGGSLVASKYTANPEDTIHMTAIPADGYVLDHISVRTPIGEVLTIYEDDPRLFQNATSASRHYIICDTTRVRDGNWWHDNSHFLMPYGDVVVTPLFVKADSTLYVIMAGNGTTHIERKYMDRLAAAGMRSFRVYDYKGMYNTSYDNNVNGYMLIDGPLGYKINAQVTTQQEGSDHFYMYDGDNGSYRVIMDVGGYNTASTTANNYHVYSYFHTDGSVNGYPGFEGRITLYEDTVTQYTIPYGASAYLDKEHLTWLLEHGVTTLTIYDSGGKDGSYGSSANGSLYLQLPDGYKVHVYGTISTEPNRDFFNLYDNEALVRRHDGEAQTDYYSTSDNLRFNFTSDGSVVRSGLVLTVDFLPDE